MNNDYDTELNIETDDEIQMDEDSILSIYELSKEDMDIADNFVNLINKIAKSYQSDSHAHLAALLKYTGNRVFKTRNELKDQKDEIENQKLDLEHKLAFTYPNTDEFNATLKAIGDAIIERRTKKDTWSILSVISTNMNKSGNFILGMNKRLYAPRSIKYKEDGCISNNNNNSGTKNSPTTMKFNNIRK